ncbi:MAG: hypothetical protein ACI4E1_07920, partial [Lachnospira sp.]
MMKQHNRNSRFNIIILTAIAVCAAVVSVFISASMIVSAGTAYRLTYAGSSKPASVTLPADCEVESTDVITLQKYDDIANESGYSYTFSKWKIDKSSYADLSANPDGSYTLTNFSHDTKATAVWEKTALSQTLTYEWGSLPAEWGGTVPAELGTLPSPVSGVTGEKITLDTTLTKDLNVQYNGKNYVFSGWIPAGETKAATSVKLKDGDDNNTVYGVWVEETYQWKTSGNVLQFNRIGQVSSTPSAGSIKIEQYISSLDADGNVVETKETLDNFVFNYNGVDGYASVDILVTPLQADYYIYKIEYEACYSSQGPVNTSWRNSDDGTTGELTSFHCDNITDGTTLKVYVTKGYGVSYNLNEDGTLKSDNSDGILSSDLPVDSKLYTPFKVEANITQCMLNTTFHNSCNETKWNTFSLDTYTTAFVSGCKLSNTLEVASEATISTDKSGDWRFAGKTSGGEWNAKTGTNYSGSLDLTSLKSGDSFAAFLDLLSSNAITFTTYVVPNKYTVTYTDGVNGTELFEDQKYTDLAYGTTTPAFVGTPEREGYTFKGWDKTIATTVTEDVVYTAQWEINKYTVTYTDGVNGTELFEDQ